MLLDSELHDFGFQRCRFVIQNRPYLSYKLWPTTSQFGLLDDVFHKQHLWVHTVESAISMMSYEACGSITAVMGPIFTLFPPHTLKSHWGTTHPAFNNHSSFVGYLGFGWGRGQRWGMLVHHRGNRRRARAKDANDGGRGFIGWGHAEGGGGGRSRGGERILK